MTLLCDYLPGPMFDDEAGTCGPALRGLVALSHLQSLTVAALPSLSRVWLFVTPGPTAPQASRSITVSWSLLKPMSIESGMPSNRLILCHPLLFSSPQSFPASESFPMSRVLTSGSQSTGASAPATVLPMNIQDWFPLGLTGLIFLQSKGLSRVFSITTVRKH